jgi:hypothetical protein
VLAHMFLGSHAKLPRGSNCMFLGSHAPVVPAAAVMARKGRPDADGGTYPQDALRGVEVAQLP